MPTPKKKKPEIEVIEQAQILNQERAYKVHEMEELVQDFDVQKILTLNEKLRSYYGKKGDEEVLELLDRMTVVMNEVREIIDQVKAKRISLEQWQREIQEKLQEINEVLRMMKDWEATGL